MNIDLLLAAVVGVLLIAAWAISANRRSGHLRQATSASLLKTLIQTLPDLVWLKDAQGVYLSCNKRFEQFFGATEAEIVGKTDYDFVDHELADFFRDHDRRAIEAGRPSTNEEWVTFANDGHRELLETIKTPIFGPAGELIGVLGIGRDITERQRIRDQLAERELMYRSVIETCGDGFWLLDQEGYILEVNDAYARKSGYRPEELIGKHVTELEALETPEETAAHIKKVMTTGRDLFQTCHRNRSGKIWEVEVSASYLSAGDGRFCAFLRDISDRAAAEQALRERDGLLRQFAANVPGVAFVVDVDGVFRLTEGRGLHQLGLDPGEVIGRSVFEHYGEIPELTDAVRRTLGGEETIANIRFNKQVFETFFVPLYDSLHQITGLLGVATDITARIRAQEERLSMERQIQYVQKLESLAVLAGGIAHDFNNLLTAILGHAELAQVSLPSTSPARTYLSEIDHAVQRASELCRQMLAYSGKGKFIIEPLELNELLEDLAHLMKGSMPPRVRIRLHLAKESPRVRGDATQIRQVVMNLLSNAAESLDDRGGDIVVESGVMVCDQAYLARSLVLDSAEPGEFSFLEVMDSGCGIAPETMPRIFEPFFTTKFTGRGLGMAAVLGIVRGHRGAIVVDSALGHGSRFRILIPSTGEQPQPRAERVTGNLQGEPFDSATVLVVDDESAVLASAAKLLRVMGLQVMEAGTGEEALARFRLAHNTIDVVLLDLTMPDKDGTEVMREMLTIDASARIVLCSGYSEQQVNARVDQRNLAGFIQKPYSMTELRQTLRRVLTPVVPDREAVKQRY